MAKILRVSIRQKSGLYKELVRDINNLTSKHTFVLSKETERTIKEKIKESIKRPGSTGTLEEAFEIYTTLNGHGVGKISYLNSVVPYWRHQNYGSEAIGANWKHWVGKGTFSPGIPQPTSQDFRGGRFTQGLNQGGKMYNFFPRNPIPAKNYIEKTLAEILPNIKNIIRNVK